MIRDIFPDVELLSSVPPDEVIAVGAALEAGLLVGRDALTCEEEPTLVEVSATDILVKVSGSQHSTETWLNVLKRPLAFGRRKQIHCLQEVDESGAEVFTTLLPSGTPLPARRHHILGGVGAASAVSIDVYQRFVTQPPEKLAKVMTFVLQSYLMSTAET